MEIPGATPGRNIWLRVGQLLDGTSTRPIHDAHVVYSSSEILFTGAVGKVPPADLLCPGQREPDAILQEVTLLPGLIEAHAHLFLEGGELNLQKRATYLKQTPEQLLQGALPRLEKLVKLGVVAVRDAGDKDGVGLALSRLYTGRRSRGQEADWEASKFRIPNSEMDPGLLTSSAAGELMPYVDSPGAAIHRRGRYGSFMADALENHPSPRACVESRVNAGAHRIKLIPTGIINFKQGAVTAEPQMTTEEIRELVAAAESFGRQTFAHASGDTGIERVIEGGVDTVEHGFFVREDQLARMRDRQIGWVQTFAPVQEQVDHADLMGWDARVAANLKRILDRHAASLVKAQAMGVPILAGSDAGSCGVPHGVGLMREMELMEQAGLSPLAVINAATGNSSNRLAFKEHFGQIKPGYLSRFILTRHSPLEGLSNLRKPRQVIFDGQVLTSLEGDDATGL